MTIGQLDSRPIFGLSTFETAHLRHWEPGVLQATSSKPNNAIRRARTEQQKALRRRTILDAASAHLAAVGFESFSMAELAKESGVAKGTLYIYFASREEVMLALHCEKLQLWANNLCSVVPDQTTDFEFSSTFYNGLFSDPAFLPLLSRLDSVIEHNVSIESLINAKRTMAALLADVAKKIAPRLELTETKMSDAIRSLASLWLGVAQIDSGPRLDTSELPDDVREFMQSFSSEETFTTNACRILTGIRAEN